VSIAAVALEYRLNANLVRRWVVTAERAGEPGSFEPALAQAEALPTRTAFVPVEVQSAAREIVIELRRGATTVKLTWPVTAAEACGAWLRELLR
jgi:transposase